MNTSGAQANPIVQAANQAVVAANKAVNGALNAVSNTASDAAAAVANTAANAAAAVSNMGTSINNTLNKAANAAADVVTNTIPTSFNSLIPISSNTPAPAAAAAANNKKNNTGGLFGFNIGASPAPAAAAANNKKNNSTGLFGMNFGSPAAAANNKVNNIVSTNILTPTPIPAVNAAVNTAVNTAINTATATNVAGGWSAWIWGPLGLFVLLLTLFLVSFAIFTDEIRQGYEYMAAYMKQALGLEQGVDIVKQIPPSGAASKDVTAIPPSLQERAEPTTAQALAEKLLPSLGSPEVFNVAQNKFTYYDAEPLCKALGAELATYQQVKDAWSKGADWCNYGWVKGQMAVYPTQDETVQKLQGGPEDQRRACGTTGVNGGVFDNPELRFGVNCYGKKPSQSAHDEKMLMSQGRVPATAEVLKINEKINEFKDEADSLFVRPFNEAKWSTGMP